MQKPDHDPCPTLNIDVSVRGQPLGKIPIPILYTYYPTPEPWTYSFISYYYITCLLLFAIALFRQLE